MPNRSAYKGNGDETSPIDVPENVQLRSVTSSEQGEDLVAGDDTAAPPAIQSNDGHVHEAGDANW